MKRALLTASLLLAPALLPADAAAPSWRVERADVRVVCPMTVGGSFEAKTSALGGTVALAEARPATFTGDLAVDLRTLDTGIRLRDEHLKTEYLEVGRSPGFETAVLSNIRLAGADASSFQGRTTFSATLALHGARHEVSGPAEVRRQGQTVRVEAAFPVALAEYGIAKPQYLGVGVKDEVTVKVSLVAAPGGPAEAGGGR